MAFPQHNLRKKLFHFVQDSFIFVVYFCIHLHFRSLMKFLKTCIKVEGVLYNASQKTAL